MIDNNKNHNNIVFGLNDDENKETKIEKLEKTKKTYNLLISDISYKKKKEEQIKNFSEDKENKSEVKKENKKKDDENIFYNINISQGLKLKNNFTDTMTYLNMNQSIATNQPHRYSLPQPIMPSVVKVSSPIYIDNKNTTMYRNSQIPPSPPSSDIYCDTNELLEMKTNSLYKEPQRVLMEKDANTKTNKLLTNAYNFMSLKSFKVRHDSTPNPASPTMMTMTTTTTPTDINKLSKNSSSSLPHLSIKENSSYDRHENTGNYESRYPQTHSFSTSRKTEDYEPSTPSPDHLHYNNHDQAMTEMKENISQSQLSSTNPSTPFHKDTSSRAQIINHEGSHSYSHSHSHSHTHGYTHIQSHTHSHDHDSSSNNNLNVNEKSETLSNSKESLSSPINPDFPLKLYSHQVGGHTPFFWLSDKALCKPLNPNERDFYELINREHPELKAYLPKYYGVVSIKMKKNMLEQEKAKKAATKEHQNHQNTSQPRINTTTTTSTTITTNNNTLDNQQTLSNLNTYTTTPPLEHCHSTSNITTTTMTTTMTTTTTTPSTINNINQQSNKISNHSSLESFLLSESNYKTTTISQTSIPHINSKTSSYLNDNDINRPSSLNLKDLHEKEMKSTSYSSNPEISKEKDLTFDQSDDYHKNSSSHIHTQFNKTFDNNHSNNTTTNINKEIMSPHKFVKSSSWSIQCQRAKWDKLIQDDNELKEFIVIEDLTRGFKNPCILDLKMGTRQHGVYATPKKRMSQERKCEMTTSKSIGVRMCGMQVYHANTQSIIFSNKYKGREINKLNFKTELLSFLDNGIKYLIEYIPYIIKQLKELYQIVEKLKTFRLYSSSLLLYYDGSWNDTTNNDSVDTLHKENQVKIKLIDFAHSTGVAHLMKKRTDNDNTNNSLLDDTKIAKDYLSNDKKSPTSNKSNDNSNSSNNNFIPVSFPPKHPNQPDSGYLFGLKNLIQTFEEIYSEFKN